MHHTVDKIKQTHYTNRNDKITKMGRVNIRTNQRESIIVGNGHKAYIEKQPGVSNWNLWRLGLDGITPLQVDYMEM